MVDLRTDGLTKSFPPSICALDGATLTIPAGECLAIVGPSGCGKTTLLRLIAGLEQPTTGEIRFGGVNVNDRPAHERDVAMLFQRPALLPAQTVRQNLHWTWDVRETWAFVRRFWSKDAGREEKVRSIAHLLGLEHDLDRPVGQLSGGQQQRVALGQCLVREAPITMLDEPLGHLDAPLRTELRRTIRAFVKERGITLLYVTHDPEEALAVGDRVAVLRHGRLVQLDSPRVLRHAPSNQFVAELIYQSTGGLNLLAGYIRQEGLDTFFENPFRRWPMDATAVTALHESIQDSRILHAGDAQTATTPAQSLLEADEAGTATPSASEKLHIMVGVPASAVHCTTAADAPDGDVRLVLPYRDQECGWSGNWVIASDARGRWIGRAGDDERFERGQALSMTFSMSRAYWFDAATGRTLLAPSASG
jgi:ABC-type sugar transport system ATPase subunit